MGFERYSGLVLTTLKYEIVEGNKVKINKKGADDNGSHDAIYVKDVKRLSNDKFEATIVPNEQVKGEFEKIAGHDKVPLFCMHGNMTEINSWLEGANVALGNHPSGETNKDGAKKKGEIYPVLSSGYYPIPVVWPVLSSGMPDWLYKENRKLAKTAGKDLAAFMRRVPEAGFPRKDLMLHSLANHVVFNWVCETEQLTPDVHFDNIFMVAADIPHDVFQTGPSQPGYEENYALDSKVHREHYCNRHEKAKRFKGLLSRGDDGNLKGKIVIFYNWDDAALGSSNIMNSKHDGNRLGKVSAEGYEENNDWAVKWNDPDNGGKRYKVNRKEELIHPEFSDCLEIVNVTDEWFVDQGGGINLKHSYQFEREIFQKYSRKLEIGSKENNLQLALDDYLDFNILLPRTDNKAHFEREGKTSLSKWLTNTVNQFMKPKSDKAYLKENPNTILDNLDVVIIREDNLKLIKLPPVVYDRNVRVNPNWGSIKEKTIIIAPRGQGQWQVQNTGNTDDDHWNFGGNVKRSGNTLTFG